MLAAEKMKEEQVPRLAISGSAALALAACTHGPSTENNNLRVRIASGASIMTAELDDTPTARSFAALLPLQLPLMGHEATEKVATLPEKLSLDGAPAGVDANAYHIAYYAPLGNFVMYYRDPGYFPGLVLLGRIQTGAETLSSASGTVTIEAINKRKTRQ
jgi:hypothetical protein